jgi:integrase
MRTGQGKADAQALEQKLRRDIFHQVDLGQQPEVSLAAAIALWLRSIENTKSHYKTGRHALALEPYLDGKRLEDAPEVADDVRRAAWAPATINARLNVLKATAKHAYRKDWIRENLSARIPLVKVHNARERYLSAAEVKKLLRKFPPGDLRDFMTLAAYTGMRAGELLSLTPDNVRGKTIRVRAEDAKAGKPRSIPVAKPAQAALGSIPFRFGHWYYHRRLTEAVEALEWPHVRLHDLRHTTASLLVNAGVDLYVVGQILGHRAVQTTQRYAHLSERTLRTAMDKIGRAA